nr:MAG TPA: hypothetical protein [Bacteriophage sp.]
MPYCLLLPRLAASYRSGFPPGGFPPTLTA